MSATVEAGDFYWYEGSRVALARVEADQLARPVEASASPIFLDPETGVRRMLGREVIVGLQPGVSSAEFFAGRGAYRPLRGTSDQFLLTVAGDGGTAILAAANELHADPRVAFSAPNFFTEVRAALDDPQFPNQWHLHNTGQDGIGLPDADVDAPEAWAVQTGDPSITIAILDDGIQLDHPDLAVWQNGAEAAGLPGIDDDGNGWIDDINGWDIRNADNDPSPQSPSDNHGTAVAGVTSARGDNGIGGASAGYGTRAMAVKTFNWVNGSDNVSDSTVAEAIYYAAGRTANGLGTWQAADALNLSWTSGASQAITAAIDWASSAGRMGLGAAVFASSGNSSSSTVSYPARLPSAIAVGATNRSDVKAGFSSYGADLDFVAPGINILTTDRTGNAGYSSGDTSTPSGTSFSSPLAAGVAGLLLSADPSLTAAEVRQAMIDAADKVGGVTYVGGFHVQYGYGRINAAEALAAIRGSSDVDLVALSASADGHAVLSIAYEIAGEAAPPFEIGVYRSADDSLSGGDTLLATLSVSDPLDRDVGPHERVVAIGPDAGQVPLPGAGAAEVDEDYFLLIVADPENEIVEPDADPFVEDNTAALIGVYHKAPGAIHVHGAAAADSIVVAPGLDLTVNGDLESYAEVDVSGIRIRAHGGSDSVAAPGVVKPLGIFGGDGDDLLEGGSASDTVTGGPGADIWMVRGTNAADTIVVSPSAVGQAKSTRGAEIDVFGFDSADSLRLIGGGGKDKLTVKPGLPLPGILEGGPDNDTLTGGDMADVLLGQEGADALNGRRGDDNLDGGSGTDTWVFDGTDAGDFLDAAWDGPQARLVVARRLSLAGTIVEVDRAAGVEKFTLSGGKGNDRIDLSALDAAAIVASGLTNRTLDGGSGADTLLGSAAGDTLNGAGGDDWLDGRLGNDIVKGNAGIDTLVFEGTSGDDDLKFTQTSSKITATRQDKGGAPLLETDVWTIDADDLGLLLALEGDDLLDVALALTIAGTANGGDGNDSCVAPAAWTLVDCES